MGSILLKLFPLGGVRLAGWLTSGCVSSSSPAGTVCLHCGPEPLGVPVSGSWKPANLLILKHDYLDFRDKLPVVWDRLLNLDEFEFPGLPFLAFIFERASKASTLSFSLIPTTTCLFPHIVSLISEIPRFIFPYPLLNNSVSMCGITTPRKTRDYLLSMDTVLLPFCLHRPLRLHTEH